MKGKCCFESADILLPDFSQIDGKKWAVVACDQHTGDSDYWTTVKSLVGDAPSTLKMILPEAFLERLEESTKEIRREMEKSEREHLVCYPDSMILTERTQSDGKVRYGLIGKLDLECYDYHKGAKSMIRATEGTVVERIPPRAAIRAAASLELPHLIVLIDDKNKTVMEPLIAHTVTEKPLYDFDLMMNGGHVRGFLLNSEKQSAVLNALEKLLQKNSLLFAVGDGNHSLAAAKQVYEDSKKEIGEEKAKNHPLRYALAEIENIHDDGLQFEPIYRVVYGCPAEELLADFENYLSGLCGTEAERKFVFLTAKQEKILVAKHPENHLPVGTLQCFLDEYAKTHPNMTVDYIHGEETVKRLTKEKGAVGFLFDGMEKSELFETVCAEGALPRKTFSMGHAEDKRYYLECRKIR